MDNGAGATTVQLLPIGEPDASIVAWLVGELGSALAPLEARPGRRFAPRDDWPDAEPGQVLADAVLDALIEWHDGQGMDPASDWLLGIAAFDLGAPGRPYVFGQATVGGCCAVVSLARLRRAGDQGAEGVALLRTRVLKEAIHELGHVAGLAHCENRGCVMYPSADLAAADAKSAGFCAACARVLPPTVASAR